jgi:hypothetical protein
MLPPFTYKSKIFEFQHLKLARVWLHPDRFQGTLQPKENHYLFEDTFRLPVKPNWHPSYLGGFLASRIGCILLWGFLPEKDAQHRLRVPGFGSISHTKVEDTHLALVAKNPMGPVGVDTQAKTLPHSSIERALKRVGIYASKEPWFDWCKREVMIKADIKAAYLLFDDATRTEVVGF